MSSAGKGDDMGVQHDLAGACPGRDDWLSWLGERERDVLAERTDLQQHLEGCQSCSAHVAEVRRFQTLVLRGRAPGLSGEQRASLEERIRLQSGLWEPPNRAAPWVIWGTALAAATALALLVLRPFADAPQSAQRVEAAVAAMTLTAGLQGDMEMAEADGRWSKVAGQLAVQRGTRLRSGQGGHVAVPGRFEVGVTAGTELELTALDGSTAWLRVRRGEVQVQVDKLKPGQRFAVMFGAFRASVLGTRFVVRQDIDGSGGHVQVTEGAVRVDAADEPGAPLDETTTVVRAGQSWHHTAGVMSLEPTPPSGPRPSAALLPTTAPAVTSVPAAAAVVPATAGAPAAREPSQQEAAVVAKQRPKAALKAGDAGKSTEGGQPNGRSILIEVPPQSMPPPDNGPDGRAR